MIIDPDLLLLFIPAALALNLTPSADMLFCLGQGLKSGPKAGVAASLGIATGSFIHTLMAALGLAVLLAAHPIAFEVVRWVGVAYLIWLGIQAFRRDAGDLVPTLTSDDGAFRAWRNGIFVCLFNPKIAIFFLAFLPQFVDPTKGSTLLQFLILGTILNIGGTVICALVGGFAGRIGRVLATNQRIARTLHIATSVVFLGLAARLAFERR